MRELKVNYAKIVDSIKHKFIVTGLVGTGITIISISHKDYSDYSLMSVVESLNEADDLSNVDNYLLSGISYNDEFIGLSELDNIFINAYNCGDTITCNNAIAAISTAVLKANIAQGYNIDFNKIENFKVIGYLGKVEVDDGEATRTEYGVSFTYDNEDYTIEAKDGMARMLCIITRSGMKNELLLEDSSENNFKYLVLPVAYEKIKEGVVAQFDYSNETHTYSNYIIGDSGYNFDGYFGLTKNVERSVAVNSNIKNKEKIVLKANSGIVNEKESTTVVEEITTNCLPVKIKK